jgi:hypothetical protein
MDDGIESVRPIAVTALMPVKNGLSYISSAKQQLSIACREFDEILIIDDNSTDGTLLQLQRWAEQDPRVRVLTNPGQGLVSALNLGLKESSNNWIARFDVDDKYATNRLEEQLKVVKFETVAVFSDYEMWSPVGRSLGKIPSPVDADAVKISLVNSRRTPHPSVLYSREAVLAVGGYRAEDFPTEDLSLWLRMSRVGEMVSVPQVLLSYQLRRDSVSGQQRALIIKRTSELLRNIGIQSEITKSAHNRIEEILDSYTNLQLGKERQLLFIQELARSVEMSGKKVGKIRTETLLRRADRKMISAAGSILSGTIKRRMYRKFG